MAALAERARGARPGPVWLDQDCILGKRGIRDGGGLTSGAGSEFDPTPLVGRGGLIVVTINYRLGVLGFFAHPALDGEGHLAGNYGFMDYKSPG